MSTCNHCLVKLSYLKQYEAALSGVFLEKEALHLLTNKSFVMQLGINGAQRSEAALGRFLVTE